MLYITSDKPVQDIQQEFSQAFPFLKLEFYTKETVAKKRRPIDQFIPVGREQYSSGKAEGSMILLTPCLTIKELRKKCEELFGISVKVYRRFSNLWLEISITEDFTLQQQNDHASEILSAAQ
ncbi:MAG: hypothetical protein INR73_16890 [Williamsia sp.]|nr:hypothetical protein [Williamsia sp.]